MSEAVIELTQLTRGFDRLVLNQVNFSLKRGTVLGLLGKNGAGKTTMIKCALGLLKPDAGRAQLFGEPAWDLSPESKQRLGYVPQSLTGFYWMRARDFLNYTGAFYSGWDPATVQARMRDWDLDPKAKVGALSEGQRQKLSIIQAMGHHPDLLVLDEPVASLDPVARRVFLKQIIELNLSAEKTILFSTHITSDIERVAAEVAILNEGQIQFSGELDHLKEKVKRLYIDGNNELPDPLPLPNLVHQKVSGTTATATVQGFDEALLPQWEKSLDAAISVESLNLEEIFLELNT